MARYHRGVAQDVVLGHPLLDVGVLWDLAQAVDVRSPADGEQHPSREIRDGVQGRSEDSGGLGQVSDDTAESQIDEGPVIAWPPVREGATLARGRLAKAPAIRPRRGIKRCRERRQVGRSRDRASDSRPEALNGR